MFKNKKNKNTATSVHQYNQFLASLDKKKDSEHEIKEEPSIDEILKHLSSVFDTCYDSSQFHGLSKKESSSNEESSSKIIKPTTKNNITIQIKKNEPVEKKDIFIDVEINNIQDLLTLIDSYPLDDNVHYNINMKALHNIQDSLKELNQMIGMHSLKNNIVDQILYFIQGLHQSKHHTGDFMHTVLYGPPGTGKTEIAKMMGKIYSKMGLLKNGVFKKVTRSDLIAGYLGQTALKTRDVIKECLGGVLFIDEAYALGNHEKRDSYSKECIDTLCEALSDHKHELIVIIAGYENELNECFFQYNQGLDSRFTWRFKTEPFKSDELYQIFLKKVKENGWNVDTEDKTLGSGWFQKNMDSFPSYGRDIETLFSKIKIVHSRRVFCKPEKEKKKIIGKDLEKGFEIYLQNENIKSKKEKEQLHKMITSMYV
jgi:SpoVK/Ycf46/Vps4 family AAA+-type ATPase